MPKGHTHCYDTGTKPTIIRYTVADHGTLGRIHDKTDISFDVVYFDIGFIGSEGITSRIS